MHKVKSMYARRFDIHCPSWESNRKYNLMFLRAQELYFNDILRHRGYVFLRDIYECLGFSVNKASLFVGWYYDKSNTFGDNYIDFGLPLTSKGNSPNVMLDFNVDGDITNRFKD